MNRVVSAGIAAFGFLWLATGASVATAQDDGDDTIRKNDKSSVAGKITSEDLQGCAIGVKGATLTFRWKDIKSIDYAGSPEFKKAKSYFDAGSFNEAMQLFEQLRKKTELRGILKPHVLNLLGSAYLRVGDTDKAIEAFNDLFKQFPKTQFLLTGAGENLIGAYLSKNNAQGAKDALDQVFSGAKQAGSDTTPLNNLRGKVQEATGDFAGAIASYNQVIAAAGSDDGAKSAAELGIARCLLGQKKTAEAEGKFRVLAGRELPAIVLAGAWNGLGDIMYLDGRTKKDADLLTNALLSYLRGCVLYTPASGESTNEYEHAVKGAHDCFKALSEIEPRADAKKRYAQCARERLEHLQTKFPGSPWLR